MFNLNQVPERRLLLLALPQLKGPRLHHGRNPIIVTIYSSLAFIHHYHLFIKSNGHTDLTLLEMNPHEKPFQLVCSEAARGRRLKDRENCESSKDCNDCQQSDDCNDCHPDDCIFNTSQHIKDVSHQHKLVRKKFYQALAKYFIWFVLGEPSTRFQFFYIVLVDCRQAWRTET